MVSSLGMCLSYCRLRKDVLLMLSPSHGEGFVSSFLHCFVAICAIVRVLGGILRLMICGVWGFVV